MCLLSCNKFLESVYIKFKKIFFLISILFILPVFSQGYKHFSIENGLPSNRIYKIIQDKKGFIWIGTDKGVSKFNGKTFSNFTTHEGLPSNDIWEIMLTDSTKIWYFTRANALGYIKNDSIYKFFGQIKEGFYPHISTNRQEAFFESYGNTFVFRDNQWEKIFHSNKKLRDSIQQAIYVKHPEIKLVIVSKSNYVHLINQKDSLIKTIDIPALEHKKLKQINDSLVVIQRIKKLFFLNLNDLKLHEVEEYRSMNQSNFYRFYATEHEIQISTQGFYAELGKDYHFKNIKIFPEKLNSNNVFKDARGNYWLSSYNKGIYLFPKNLFATRYHLMNKKIRFLKKTSQGDILAGVLDKGIYIFDKNQEKFKMLYPKKEYIYDIFYVNPDNFVIFGKDTTLVKKQGKITPFYFAGRKAVIHNKYYYTTTTAGLYKFDSNLNFVKEIPIRDPNVLTIYKNKLLAGGINGLYEIRNDSVIPLNFNKNYQNISITSIKPYQDKLLIGTDGSGLFIWDGKNQIKFVSNTDGLIIQDILVQEKNVWLATQNGVLGYRFTDQGLKFIQTIRKFDGLPSDQVINIVLNGNRMIAASYNGISSFDIYQKPSLPLQNLYFKEKKYGNQIINKNNHEFKFGKNKNLKIKFATIDFSGQEHNNYFYKLEPIQNYWVKTQARDIDFNNLPPDDYVFKIKVSNPYGQIFTNHFNFKIIPLWWQTGWAKTLFALLLIFGISFIIIAYRKKELNKQRKKLLAQKERVEFELYALRSQMNPHFVFNSLNAIQYYINDGNYDKSETYLVKFSRLIRMIFDFSRYKTVQLSQEIKLLKSYLEIEKMRFGKDFNFCIEIDNDLQTENREIPTMLLQPIVENAVNHGIFHKQGNGTICLQFKKINSKTFEVIISDNGVGVEKSKEIQKNSLKKHQSRSTQILKKRIELLNMSGKWKISYKLDDLTQTEHEYNTRVTLKITKL